MKIAFYISSIVFFLFSNESIAKIQPCFSDSIIGNNRDSVFYQFHNCTTPTSGLTYHWDFGDGDTSNLKNPIHAYSDTGCVTIKLIIKDSVETDTLERRNFICIPWPFADFSIVKLCNSGLTDSFINKSYYSKYGTPYTSWNFGDNLSGSGNTSTEINPTHRFSGPGWYTIKLTISNNSFYHSEWSSTIYVDSSLSSFNLNSSIVTTTDTFCATDNVTGIYNYEWRLSNILGKTIDTGTGAKFCEVLKDTGIYTLCLTASDLNNCNEKICKKIIVSGANSVKSIKENNSSVSITPNPAEDMLFVKTSLIKNQHFYIFNSYGQKIDEGDLTQEGEINVRQLSSGLYFLRINNYKGEGEIIKFSKN